MKQTVRLRRVETLEVEIEVLQPLARATLANLFNTAALLGGPQHGKVLVSKVSDYEILGSSPNGDIQAPKTKSKPRGR